MLGFTANLAAVLRTLMPPASAALIRIDLFLHQQGLDTTTPAGKATFQMLGVFAEFERSIIQERVRAGLQRAKREPFRRRRGRKRRRRGLGK